MWSRSTDSIQLNLLNRRLQQQDTQIPREEEFTHFRNRIPVDLTGYLFVWMCFGLCNDNNNNNNNNNNSYRVIVFSHTSDNYSVVALWCRQEVSLSVAVIIAVLVVDNNNNNDNDDDNDGDDAYRWMRRLVQHEILRCNKGRMNTGGRGDRTVTGRSFASTTNATVTITADPRSSSSSSALSSSTSSSSSSSSLWHSAKAPISPPRSRVVGGLYDLRAVTQSTFFRSPLSPLDHTGAAPPPPRGLYSSFEQHLASHGSLFSFLPHERSTASFASGFYPRLPHPRPSYSSVMTAGLQQSFLTSPPTDPPPFVQSNLIQMNQLPPLPMQYQSFLGPLSASSLGGESLTAAGRQVMSIQQAQQPAQHPQQSLSHRLSVGLEPFQRSSSIPGSPQTMMLRSPVKLHPRDERGYQYDSPGVMLRGSAVVPLPRPPVSYISPPPPTLQAPPLSGHRPPTPADIGGVDPRPHPPPVPLLTGTGTGRRPGPGSTSSSAARDQSRRPRVPSTNPPDTRQSPPPPPTSSTDFCPPPGLGLPPAGVVHPPPPPTPVAFTGASQQPQPQQPHYPPHFSRGSIIQLGNGRLKRVEELQTKDFVDSAGFSRNLRIDSSTVIHMRHNHERNTVVLGFSVGQQNIQVTVEATLEHPFFVYNQGWSSYSPDLTLHRYGLNCHQLSVGNCCISLTQRNSQSPPPIHHRTPMAPPTPSSAPVDPPQRSPSRFNRQISHALGAPEPNDAPGRIEGSGSGGGERSQDWGRERHSSQQQQQQLLSPSPIPTSVPRRLVQGSSGFATHSSSPRASGTRSATRSTDAPGPSPSSAAAGGSTLAAATAAAASSDPSQGLQRGRKRRWSAPDLFHHRYHHEHQRRHHQQQQQQQQHHRDNIPRSEGEPTSEEGAARDRDWIPSAPSYSAIPSTES